MTLPGMRLYFNLTGGSVAGAGANTLTLNTDGAAFAQSGNQIIWTLPVRGL